MSHAGQTVRMYEDLAYIYDRQNQPSLRDWFLILAADMAYSAGWEDETERLRVQLLSYNPHHLLKPFASFAEARRSPDIENYIEDLRRNYPPETAEQMLENHRPSILSSSANRANGNDPSGAPAFAATSVPDKSPRVIYPNDSAEFGPLLTISPTSRKPPRSRTSASPARHNRAFALRPSPLAEETNHAEQAYQNPEVEQSSDEEEPFSTANRTIATLLFWLFFLIALAIAAYVVIVPFLPANLS